MCIARNGDTGILLYSAGGHANHIMIMVIDEIRYSYTYSLGLIMVPYARAIDSTSNSAKHLKRIPVHCIVANISYY